MPTARLTSLARTLALSGVLAASLAACGGDDGGTLSPIDGSVAIDAGVGMHDAAEQYPFSAAEAEVTMAAALARFEADAEASGAEDLVPEVDLARAMLALIEARAPQGTLYGS